MTETRLDEYPNPELKKRNIFVMIIFMVITGWIYQPIWFIGRRKILNKLQSDERLGILVFVFALIAHSFLYGYGFGLGAYAGWMEGQGEIDQRSGNTVYTISAIISTTAFILLWFQAFKVRKMLINHYNKVLDNNIHFSWVKTFFFHIFYLQYVMNRLH